MRRNATTKRGGLEIERHREFTARISHHVNKEPKISERRYTETVVSNHKSCHPDTSLASMLFLMSFNQYRSGQEYPYQKIGN